jgi:hypothetical protein
MIALALILAAILLSQLTVIFGLTQKLRQGAAAAEGMARYEKRYAEAGKFLPHSGVIGYLSDAQDGTGLPQGLYSSRYYSAQYYLAPLIITDSVEPDLILGNFFLPDGMQKAMAKRKFLVLHDFQNGVFILRKEGP